MERIKQSIRHPSPLRKAAAAHPCLFVLAGCLLCTVLGFGSQEHFGILQAGIVWLAGSTALLLLRETLCQNKVQLSVMEVLWSALCIWLGTAPSPAQWWIVGGVTALVLLFGSLYASQRLTDGLCGALLCGMGFCMRFAYVLATPYYVRQHDVGRFGGESGHAFYIEYLFTNGHLPDFDVREVWQCYHPPLHHSIAAVWMRLLHAFGVPYEQICESVQLLPFAYSCICLVLFWKLLQHFQLQGAAMAIPLGIMAFHPTFLLLGGSINNDMLSITFFLWAILLTCRWYREQKLSVILQLAIAIGCGMMTKLSVWMAAPAAAAVFLLVLYKNRRTPRHLIGQYAAFGAVCIPLGLGWGIRNLVRFGVPLTYVPMLSSASEQYVGDIPVLQRLFDMNPKQWLYVYDCFTMYGQSYNEYNPTFGLLKTALFDELINTKNYPAIAGFGEFLFFSQILVILVSLIGIVMVLRRRNTTAEHWQLLLTYGITLVSYYSFCIMYAHTCTQNIRYATPLILIGCLFLGMWLQKGEKLSPAGILRKVLFVPALLFMLGSYLVYAVVCV